MRTEEELAVFKRALKAMNKLYASITGTAVLKLTDIAPRPAEYDGWVAVFQPPKVAHDVVAAQATTSRRRTATTWASSRAGTA